jgi:hypothetical protein
MVLTRSMKSKGITLEDKVAASVLVNLHKDNTILKNLKNEMERKHKSVSLRWELDKAKKELQILKTIKKYDSAKRRLEEVIHESSIAIEDVNMEIAALYSSIENL